MNWLILTVLSAITGSLTRILQKVLLTDKQSDPFAFAFFFQLTVAGLFFIYTLTTNSFETPNLQGLSINIIIMALFYSLGNLFTFKAFKIAQASEVSIIFASSTVWSVISAVLFLGERISITNIIGILCIVASIISINYTKSKWKFNKGHLYALLGALLFGLAFTNDAYIIERYSSVASYMVLAFLLPGIVVILFSPKSISSVKYFIEIKTFAKLLLCSVFYALSAITIFTAYKNGGQASIISPIQQTSIIFTVILGYSFLKEKDRITNKVIGAIFAFIGVLFLI